MFITFRRASVLSWRGIHYRPLLIVAFMALALSVFSQSADAAPSYAGGDCWQSGTPLWCRTTWSGGSALPIYVIPNFDSQRPMWEPALDYALNQWNGVPGPQQVSRQRQTNDSWVFFDASSTGQDGLQPGNLGVTWECDSSNYCTPGFESMYVSYNSIKLNTTELDIRPIGYNDSTQAHELGHALGLDHSLDTNQLMYKDVGPDKPATVADTGILPPCSGSDDQHGLRCIYNWNH